MAAPGAKGREAGKGWTQSDPKPLDLPLLPHSPEGAEEPMASQRAHGIAAHPISIQLLDARDEVDNEDLQGR